MDVFIPEYIKYDSRGFITEFESPENKSIKNEACDVYIEFVNEYRTVLGLYENGLEKYQISLDHAIVKGIITKYGISFGKFNGKFKVATTPRGYYTLVLENHESLVAADSLTPGHTYYVKEGDNNCMLYLCTSTVYSNKYPFAPKRKSNWYLLYAPGSKTRRIVHLSYAKSKLFKTTYCNEELLKTGLSQLKTNAEFSPISIVNSKLRYYILSKNRLITLLTSGIAYVYTYTKEMSHRIETVKYDKNTGVFSISSVTSNNLLDLMKANNSYDDKLVKLMNENYLHE